MKTPLDQFSASLVYREQNKAAYESLVNKYFQSVLRFLSFKLPKLEDAEDLTAEVFLRSWEYMTSSEVDNPRALFFRIARNLLSDFYRQRKGKGDITDEGVLEAIPASLSLPEQLTGKMEAEKVLKALKTLKAEYQEVLTLYAVAELEIEEIAATLNKTANNVRVLIFRARQALLKLLK